MKPPIFRTVNPGLYNMFQELRDQKDCVCQLMPWFLSCGRYCSNRNRCDGDSPSGYGKRKTTFIGVVTQR